MVYICERCEKSFKQKGHYESHLARKNPCKKTTHIEKLIEKKVAEAVKAMISPTAPQTPVNTVVFTAPTAHGTTKQALSLFSGAGGDTCGLKKAGWTVTHYSEFNAPAIRTHNAAFPSSTLLTGPDKSTDIKKITDETFTALKGKVDLIFAGHPCFVAGTKVLTQNGYKPIEKVSIEDKLLTHTGIYQPIVNLQSRICESGLIDIRIKYHPNDIRATNTHPFYVRTRIRKWDNIARKYLYSFSPPAWKPLGEMNKDDFCGMAINTETIVPSHTINIPVNAFRTDSVKKILNSKDEWFMMGYFVGDGWIQNTRKTDGRSRHTIRFAIADKDTKTVLKRISSVLSISDKHVRTGACGKYGCSNLVWYTILKDFGKYAHGKCIPEWVHSAPSEFVNEFLDGYIAADGCYRKSGDIRMTTVSYDLAMGIQRLFLKVGKIASVQMTIRSPKHMICGRVVNQRNTYEITVVPNPTKQHSGFIDNGYAWMAPFHITPVTIAPTTVYNFEVAIDNSYVVENTVVHNCQGFSHAGKKRADDPRNELVHEFVRAARLIKPQWIIGENVKGLLSRKGVYPANTPPRPVIQIIKDLFEAEGYKITYRVINATEVGVPQLRNRLIYVGHRGDSYPHLPWDKLPTPKKRPTIRALLTPTLEGAMEFPTRLKPTTVDVRFWISTTETTPSGSPHPNLVRLVEGIRNLSTKEKTELGHTDKEVVPHIEEDGLISFGVRKSGYHGQVLDPDAPSKTIICAYTICPRLFVGLHNATIGKYWIRCLTPEECGAIQGFPSDFAWQGTAKDKITQIGNAVPPPLATAVANLLSQATFHTTPQDLTVTTGIDSDSDDE